MQKIVLIFTAFIFNVAFASFDYAPSVRNHRNASVLDYIEAALQKNCPAAKSLRLYGTDFQSRPQHRDLGIEYTVTYGVYFGKSYVADALMVQSRWGDEFGGTTIPFTILMDRYQICRR